MKHKSPLAFLNQPGNPRLAASLGMGPRELQALQGLPSSEIKRRFEELQKTVQKRFKELAFDLHPDRNQGDPEATKKFTHLKNVKDALLQLQLSIRPRQLQPIRQVIVTRGVSFNSTTTNSTTTSSTTNWTWRSHW